MLLPNQKVVFICSGNICRSPLAEYYARSLGLESDSCGIDCGVGFPADPRASEFAKQLGLDLGPHKTKRVDQYKFLPDDIIVVMEPKHLKKVKQHIGEHQKLFLAGMCCPDPFPYLHDPYNCNKDFFRHCEEFVVLSVRGMYGKK